MHVEFLAGNARLDHDVKVFRIDLENAVHPRQIDGNTARRRIHMAFQRCAGAERNDRHLPLAAQTHHFLNVFGRFGENHEIGGLVGDIAGGMAMLFADGFARLRVVTKPFLKNRNNGRNTIFIARHCSCISQCHSGLQNSNRGFVQFACIFSQCTRLVQL